ncbi:MAG: type IV pilin-like G/H family protein [Xenococcaceae cyanobacterium MO_188.B32]|nr:type IV pilin-like G/H family protein [Xenococcaceae cyanobacterium MO_188.B32]
MNNVFAAKLLQNLRNKKGEKGFTLIELLVVVIIVGVLAAVALPNLLGQVGKARETEAKNAIGTINRGQQSYHFDAKVFVPATADADFQAITNPFGLSLVSAVYNYDVAAPTSAAISGLATATPVSATDDGVRGFGGLTAYTAGTGVYGMAVCQGTSIGTIPSAITVDTTDPDANTCTDGVIIK